VTKASRSGLAVGGGRDRFSWHSQRLLYLSGALHQNIFAFAPAGEIFAGAAKKPPGRRESRGQEVARTDNTSVNEEAPDLAWRLH